MTVCLPLMKKLLTPLAKSILIPLGLLAGMSAADAAIQKQIYGSGTAALIISSEMEDIMKKVKSLFSGLLVQEISETTKMKQKNKNSDFFQCY